MGLGDAANPGCNQPNDTTAMNTICDPNDLGNNIAADILDCDNSIVNSEPDYSPNCDLDGDGFRNMQCSNGDDCNDNDPFRPYPASTECGAGETWADGLSCRCLGSGTPVLIDPQGDGFALTSNADGVNFDLNGDGRNDRVSWTVSNSDDGWLALDRNGNETIDSGQELFGNFTPQPTSADPHGFLALAEFDRIDNGGNGNGIIDFRDSIFNSLQIWQDTNHNGTSEANELRPLAEVDIVSIDLDYKESRRTDEHGNRFKYRAKVRDAHDARMGRWAWDVYLVVQW